mgnify:FL=1
MAKVTPSLVVIGPATLVLYHPVLTKTKFDSKTRKSVVDDVNGSYNATFLIPQSDTVTVEAVKAAYVKAAKETNSSVEFKDWSKKFTLGEKVIEKAMKKNPDKSADRMAYMKGMWVLEAKSKFAPDLSKAVGGKAVEVPSETADREFYSGCLCKAELNLVGSQIESGENTNRYLTAYVNFIVKVGEGDRLGRKSRDDVFKGALGGSSAQDPTSGDEDF